MLINWGWWKAKNVKAQNTGRQNLNSVPHMHPGKKGNDVPKLVKNDPQRKGTSVLQTAKNPRQPCKVDVKLGPDGPCPRGAKK